MACGIIGKDAERAVTRKLKERLWLQERQGEEEEEEEEGVFKASDE